MTSIRTSRICLIVTMAIGLNGCSRAAEKPITDPSTTQIANTVAPAPKTTSASEPVAPTPAAAPVTPPNTQAATRVSPATAPAAKPPDMPAVQPPTTTAVKPPATTAAKPPVAPAVKPPATTAVKPPATPAVKPPVASTAKPPAVASAKPPAAPAVKPPGVPGGNQAATTTQVPAATQPAAVPNAPVTLDLAALEKQLRSTKAIGVFSKIALKNQVDDLMKEFRQHYKGRTPPSMTDLRRSYDLLMMKVLSMVQDDDQKLASAIVASRTAIWDLLSDPKKFAALDA